MRLGVGALLLLVAVGLLGAAHASARTHRPAAPLHLAVLGDSLAAGFDASARQRSWPDLVRAGLAGGSAVSLSVDGRPGWTTVRAVAARVPAPRADVVVVEYGTNDVAHSSLGAFTAAYRTLLDRVRRASPRAVLVCAGPWADPARAAPLERVVSAECRQRGGLPVALSGLFAEGPLHAVPASRWSGGVVPNAFHPDDRGHARIAAAVLDRLRSGPGSGSGHRPTTWQESHG